jgi:hypothetical protein
MHSYYSKVIGFIEHFSGISCQLRTGTIPDFFQPAEGFISLLVQGLCQIFRKTSTGADDHYDIHDSVNID